MCQSIARLLSLGPGGSYAMAPPGTHSYWVRQATRRLSAAPFGQWREDPSNPMSKDVFDREFWTRRTDRLGSPVDVLEVKSGKQPSEAIDAILDRPNEWKHDCDHALQIANLFAIRMMLGANAFNARIAASIPAAMRMQLRARESDGLKTAAHFGRDAADDDWRVVTKYDAGAVKADPNDQRKQISSPFVLATAKVASKDETWTLVGAAPVGSRVRFTNTKAFTYSSFRHENAIKLAYDLYAASWTENPLIAWWELNEADVDLRLAQSEDRAATPAYVRDHVFIDEVEVFEPA